MGYTFKAVEDLVFTDDFMFGAVMREPHICKGVLERLLQIKIDRIEYPELQKTLSPFYTQKGVRLDVYVEGGGRVFDVECQTYRIKSIGRRTRYYQSMIDMDSLLRGTDYAELKESYIIFICLDDPFGAGLPVYTFVRSCAEDKSVSLGDGTHHLVFNAAAYEREENGEIKDFLAFVKGNAPKSNFTKEIATMVQAKKFQNTFLNEYMAIQLHEHDVEERAMQRGISQGIERGISQGERKASVEAARNALALGIPVEQVAKITGLSVAEIGEL